MTKKVESGKARMYKASFLLIWEELKTMNRKKLKALYRFSTGYLKYKLFTPKKRVNDVKALDSYHSGYVQ